MTRVMRIWLLVLLFAVLPSVGMAGHPSRIVSLDLCTDWMLLKYATPSTVLALSPWVREYPRAGLNTTLPSHDGSLEQILSLKPDLVIVGEFNASLLQQRLRKLGVHVAVLPLATTLQQVTAYEKAFLKLLGESGGRASIPVPAMTSQAASPAPRLLLLGANGGGTGEGTLENDVMLLAGWKNYVSAQGYVTVELERLISDPPDAIMWSAPASQALANSFMQHPALKRAIPASHWLATDFADWQCQGPWTWQRVKQLQQARQVWHAP